MIETSHALDLLHGRFANIEGQLGDLRGKHAQLQNDAKIN